MEESLLKLLCAVHILHRCLTLDVQNVIDIAEFMRKYARDSHEECCKPVYKTSV